MKNIFFFSAYLLFQWMLSSCNSDKKISNQIAQDSVKIFFTRDGRISKDTLDNKQWIYQKEYKVIKKMRDYYGVELKLGGYKNVFFLEVKRIKEENSWPEVMVLIDQLTELKLLRLTSEEINSLNFKRLKKLESLDVFYPNNICDTLVMPALSTHLQSFSIERAKITHITFPEENYAIEYLMIKDTQIKQLDKSIAKLSELKQLFLSHNQLRQLPAELNKLSSLQEIRLTSNQLKNFDIQLPKLKKLRLGGSIVKDSVSIRKRYPGVIISFDK